MPASNATAPRRFDPFTLPVPRTDRALYHDPDCRGHSVRVSANGERVSYLYRKVGGRPVKMALGVFDASIPASREIPKDVDPLTYVGNRPSLNLRMARALAARVTVELNMGSNPATVARDARRAREGELTLAGAYDRYEQDYLVPQGKKSTADLRACFERYLGEMPDNTKKKHGRQRKKSPHGVDWSRRRLSEIREDAVRRLMISLKDGHGPHTANRVGEIGRAVYNKMIEWKDYKGDNPFASITWFDEVSRERFVRAEEAPAFFKALNALPAGPFKDFVYLSLFTGARRSNVLAMAWTDLDLHSATWTVPAVASKNKRSMTIPLTRRAVELIEKRHDGGEFVFPADSKSGHMSPPKKQWAALLKSADLTDLRLHDLRRSLGSWAVNTGASLAVVGSALGHSSPQATRVYARLQVDPVRDAMQRAQDAMLLAAEMDIAGPATRKTKRKRSRTLKETR